MSSCWWINSYNNSQVSETMRDKDVEIVFIPHNYSYNDTSNVSNNNQVDDETFSITELVCFAGVTTLVCLIGIPTNVVNCLVFCREGLRDRMNLCLFCLSLVDALYLACDFIIFSVSSFIAFYDTYSGKEFFYKCVCYLVGTAYGFRIASGLVTMVIAVERCLCVVFPLRAATLVSSRTMAGAFLLLVLILQASYLPNPFSFKVFSMNTAGSIKIFFVPTEFYLRNVVLISYLDNTVLGVVVPIGTFIVVTMATAITIVKLRAAMEWREASCSVTSSNLRHQRALTTMLVLVTCLYVVSMVPFVVQIVVRLYLQEYSLQGRYSSTFHDVSAIVHVFPRINSAFDFFIYYFRSSRFRTVLNSLLPCVSKPTPSCKSSTTKVSVA